MIPSVCYPDLVPADVAIQTLERSTHVDGNVSDFELDVINRLVRYHEPATAFEIGTFDGRTTLNIAAHAAPDARVFTLDLPPSDVDDTELRIDVGDRLFIDKPASGARFADSELAHRITQLYGDSATFDFSPYFGKIDFLFVDGSHSYDYVLKDSQTALRIVRPGGVVLWHDYVPRGPTSWPGLTRAFHEMYAGDPRFKGVRHIAGTSIVMLQLPGSVAGRAARPLRLEGAFRDSRQMECLGVALSVVPLSTSVSAGEPVSVRVRAENIGRATWLPSNSPIGPVRLGSRLFDASGTCLDENYSRHALPGNEPVVQGASAVFDADVPSPPPGRYVLEFDVVADGVVWFSRNGSTPVRVPIEVQPATRHELDASALARLAEPDQWWLEGDYLVSGKSGPRSALEVAAPAGATAIGLEIHLFRHPPLEIRVRAGSSIRPVMLTAGRNDVRIRISPGSERLRLEFGFAPWCPDELLHNGDLRRLGFHLKKLTLVS